MKNEQIPLGARILAVIDIFDALTADRAYRKAKTEEWALEYVKSESGGALEPKLVECFSALHRVWCDTRRRSCDSRKRPTTLEPPALTCGHAGTVSTDRDGRS